MKRGPWIFLSILPMLAACAVAPQRREDHDALPLPHEADAYLDIAWFAEPLTPTRVVQAALANHPVVRAEIARLEVADAERVQAGLLRNPMLSLMTLVPESGGRIAVEAGWMQSLYDLLRRQRRIDLADAQWRQERAETLQRLLDLAWSAQSAYYEAIATAQRQQLLRDELAIDAQVLALKSRLAQSGAVNQADLLQSQAMQDERRHLLHAADAAQVAAKSMLAEKLGLPSRSGVNLPATWSRPNIPQVDVAVWSTKALSQRVELQASAASIDIARHQRRLEIGRLRATEPEIGVQLERSDEDVMVGPALRIALPLFDDGRARADRADALLREAGHRNEAQRRAVMLSVERAAALLFVARAAADDAVQHRERVQTADALSAAQHRNGSIDLLSRLEIQRTLIAAAAQVVDAELNLTLAHIELQRALGGGLVLP